jgi:hypothetical protein
MEQGGTVNAVAYIFFYGRENENHHWEQDICAPQNSSSS